MENGAPYIYDVTERDFQEKVVDVSFSVPVMVDFWAEWCGPCKALGPILEKAARSYGGAVVFARVDVDRNGGLAARFGIRSIPAVKFFRNGEVVDEFVGLVQESEVRAIIDSLAEDGTDRLLARAAELLTNNRIEEAAVVYQAILEREPDHSGARIGLARIHIANGEDAAARELLEAVPETDDRRDEARTLLGLFDLVTVCEKNGGFERCLAAAELNPDDLEARYILGCCHVAADEWRNAFETFLSIVAEDRAFGDGKARKAMLVLFSALGSGHELTEEYRKKLAMVLF